MEQLALTIVRLEQQLLNLKRQHVLDLKRNGFVLLCIQNNIYHSCRLFSNIDLISFEDELVYLIPRDHILYKLFRYQFSLANIIFPDFPDSTKLKIPKNTIDKIIQEIKDFITLDKIRAI